MNIEVKRLGEFDISTGKVIVSDPYLETNSEYQLVLSNVKVGKWISWSKCFNDSRRMNGCASLTVKHESAELIELEEINIKYPCHITTVKGGIGIFDVAVYQNNSSIKSEVKSLPQFGSDWYVYCLKYIYSDIGAGVIFGGTVSCTPFTDKGKFYVNIHEDSDGVIDAIHIKLLDIENIEVTYEDDDTIVEED